MKYAMPLLFALLCVGCKSVSAKRELYAKQQEILSQSIYDDAKTLSFFDSPDVWGRNWILDEKELREDGKFEVYKYRSMGECEADASDDIEVTITRAINENGESGSWHWNCFYICGDAPNDVFMGGGGACYD